MVCALTAYIDFCYIARRASLSTHDLDKLDAALERYHFYRPIFQTLRVREPGPAGLSLPRQHAMKHYRNLIEQFAAPNGLCSSIKAVKEPWQRSNRYKALGQMLQTNQRLDKLMAARVDFANRGMLDGSIMHWVWEYLDRMVHLLDREESDHEGGEEDQRGGGDEDERGKDEERGWTAVMRGATMPVVTGEKTGIKEAVAADADEGLQVPNKEDGGPVNDDSVINRVVLAKTARKLEFFTVVCHVQSLTPFLPV